MPPELTESTSPVPATEDPSYSPPANEPQGLEPTPVKEETKDPETKETPETKGTSVKLPASIKPPAKTGRFQERISDLVNQRDLSKREADQLRDQVARLTKGAETKTAVPATKDEGVVNPEDFPTYGDYITALVNSTIEKKAASQKSQQAKTDYETYKQERLSAFNEHAAPLAQQYGEGFWDTITDPSLPVTEVMADAIMELGQIGPYTMLYLSTHREEALRIAKLNPRAATMEIGRLADKIDAEIKQGVTEGSPDGTLPASTSPSNQGVVVRPTPVPTPRGSSPGLNNAPNDKDTVDEWLRKETDRLRRINPNARFYGAR